MTDTFKERIFFFLFIFNIIDCRFDYKFFFFFFGKFKKIFTKKSKSGKKVKIQFIYFP